ncbi:helix-turn-helix domain-containing protein [Salmonella enterica]
MIKAMTVTDIISFIEINLENKISMDAICDYTGYSRRYIQVIFKQYINMTLWQYIKYRRITRAALLLRLTSSKIIDISYRLHFGSQQSFHRDFKKIVGCTPLQYRNNSDWDLKPILSPRTADFNPPASPEICFVKSGFIYGYEIFYEQKIMNANKPFPMRWKVIDKHLKESSSALYLLSDFYTEKKTNSSIRIKTILGRQKNNELHKYKPHKYSSGMYVRITHSGCKEKYVEHVIYYYLVVLPHYSLKRKEGYDIEIISKDEFGYNCELLIPVVFNDLGSRQ